MTEKPKPSRFSEIQSWIDPEGGLYCVGAYIAWDPAKDDACLDGHFTLAQLEQIVLFMQQEKEF